MIDIHCHIIPGVDDGSQNMEESLQMIAAESAAGTRAFIATSHVIEKPDYARLGLFHERLGELKEAVAANHPEVAIYPGGEIYPSRHMLTAVDEGLPVTLANLGQYMLVDLPMGPVPNDFEDLLYELQIRRITPIVAHPERCATFQMNPDALQPFLDKGIAFQVNAGSLIGKYGPRANEVAWMYLRRHWAQFLGSDLHKPPRRANLAFARDAVAAELSEDYVDLLVNRSGQAILDNVELPERPKPDPAQAKKVERPEKPGLLQRLFRR